MQLLLALISPYISLSKFHHLNLKSKKKFTPKDQGYIITPIYISKHVICEMSFVCRALSVFFFFFLNKFKWRNAFLRAGWVVSTTGVCVYSCLPFYLVCGLFARVFFRFCRWWRHGINGIFSTCWSSDETEQQTKDSSIFLNM